MLELKGRYNTANVYTDNIESDTISQIINLCNQEFVKDSKIRIMPDTHAGTGCTIGTTMTITDKIVPNLVGVDIGCGMLTVKISNKDIDLQKLDDVIRNMIPHGIAYDVKNKQHRSSIRKSKHSFSDKLNLEELYCKKNLNYNSAILAIGSLGSGNHFIEIDEDDEGFLYLVIHTGSRHLGIDVAKYYQNLAYKTLIFEAKEEIINKFKSEGRDTEIQDELKKINFNKISKDLAYLQGKNFDDYLHDINIVQKYANLNRETIAHEIISNMKFDVIEKFHTIHNYVDTKSMILRKGAISAQQGERVLIPINMRDGSIIAIGKGNADWNYSAPHGAGRLMSRSSAKSAISLDEFKDSMKNVWSTSVSEFTIDESPMAYKPMDEIINNIQDTVEIKKIIKPIYNFKSN